MEPVHRKKLYEQVLERLIAGIATAQFPPGSQLPSERELMDMVGVGRPSIREAMLTLQQMGLIKITHGERARVVEPTPELIISRISSAVTLLLTTSSRGLEDLKEVRAMVEKGLVRIAAQNATSDHLKRLQDAVDRLRETAGNTEPFIAADMDFHCVIADTAGNAIISAAMRGILQWLSEFKRDLVSVEGAEHLTIEEHERILAAIRAGDPDAAEEAMENHLKRANDLYRQFVT